MKPKDEIIVGPILDNGARPYVCRSPEGALSKGLLGGSPETSKGTVELAHLGGNHYEDQKVTRFTAGGPAQVASDQYRDGWSRIFGSRAPVGQA